MVFEGPVVTFCRHSEEIPSQCRYSCGFNRNLRRFFVLVPTSPETILSSGDKDHVNVEFAESFLDEFFLVLDARKSGAFSYILVV